MRGGPYLDFLKAQSAGADHVSSVCEGALLLAAAGLLDGYRATTHWAFIPCLKQFPAIKVADGFRATSSTATASPAAAFRRGWTRRWRSWPAWRDRTSPSTSR